MGTPLNDFKVFFKHQNHSNHCDQIPELLGCTHVLIKTGFKTLKKIKNRDIFVLEREGNAGTHPRQRCIQGKGL